MKFFPAHSPPPRHDGVDHKTGHQFIPKQGLAIFWTRKVLLDPCEHVGQVRERPNQVAASARSPAAAEQARRLPGLLSSGGHFSREIVEADEQGIMVERLSCRRLIIGVVESDERISQERSELAARLSQFGVRARRLDYLRQIGLHLKRRVAVIVEAGGPFAPFGRSKERPWHLEFPKLLCEWYQFIADRCSLCHLIE